MVAEKQEQHFTLTLNSINAITVQENSVTHISNEYIVFPKADDGAMIRYQEIIESNTALSTKVDLLQAISETNTASLEQSISVLSSKVESETYLSNILQSTFNGAQNSINDAHADILSEKLVRASEDSLISQKIDIVKAELQTVDSELSSTIQTTQQSLTSDIEAIAAQQTSLTSQFNGFVIDTTTKFTSKADVTQVIETVADSQEAYGQMVVTLASAYDLENQNIKAKITQEQMTRANADEALAQSIVQLTATFQTTNSHITSSQLASATNVEALANMMIDMNAAFQGDILSTQALIAQESNTRAANDSAISVVLNQQIATYNADNASRFNTINNNITALQSSDASTAISLANLDIKITTEEQARINAILVEQQARINAINAEATARGIDVSNLSSAYKAYSDTIKQALIDGEISEAEQNAITTAQNALDVAKLQLQIQINIITQNLTQTTADMQELTQTVANENEAMAKQMFTYNTAFVHGDFQSNAKIETTEKTLSTANSSLAQRIDTLSAQMVTDKSELHSSINEVSTAIVTSDEAQATINQTLQAGINDVNVELIDTRNILMTTKGWVANACSLVVNPTTGFVTGWSYGDGSQSGSNFKISADHIELNGTTTFSAYAKIADVNGSITALGSTLSSSINTAQTKANDAYSLAYQKATLAQVQALGYVVPSGVADAINNNTTKIDGSKITTGSLSALSANLGTVTAGKAQNSTGTNYVNFNATGTSPFIKVGSNISLNADGSGSFSRSIVSAPKIVANGTGSCALDGGYGTAYVKTGIFGSSWVTTGENKSYSGRAALTDLWMLNRSSPYHVGIGINIKVWQHAGVTSGGSNTYLGAEYGSQGEFFLEIEFRYLGTIDGSEFPTSLTFAWTLLEV